MIVRVIGQGRHCGQVHESMTTPVVGRAVTEDVAVEAEEDGEAVVAFTSLDLNPVRKRFHIVTHATL